MTLRNLAIWGVIALLAAGLYSMVTQGAKTAGGGEESYSQLLANIDAGRVKSAVLHAQSVDVIQSDGKHSVTTPLDQGDLVKELRDHGADITVTPVGGNMVVNLLIQLLPFILLGAVYFFFMRQMQGGARGAMGFGKSKARLLTENKNRVTFDDVAGVDEAKDELAEIVDFLKDPSRVRDMFEQAKKNSPCIIFIDEIDAVGRHRGAGLGGGNDEREQTLNQLLVELDGFEANEGIIVIASTNRPDVLDPALLRPGRFDRQVVVPNPDVTGREKIIRVHMRNVPLAADVNVRTLARGTPGFSGADLANLVNEAALLAARRNRRMVTMHDFEHAKDKVMMGAERKSMAMSDHEKRNTAYHEGGHTLVALTVPGADPVHKVTIIPRGRALGMVMQLPEGDRYSMDFQQMTSRLAILLAGRVAEELIFGKDKVTSGASSDIQAATSLARNMVTRWGYSDAVGMVSYGDNQEEVFLGHSVARTQNVSEDTAQKIDSEVRRLVQNGLDEARRILTERVADLHTLAKALLEFETLTGDEVENVLKGIKPNRDDDLEEKRPPAPSVAVPLTHAPDPEPA
jgi:cell division protease FtsH